MFSVILAIILILIWLAEYQIHRFNQRNLKVIIDVNGSRGKSSVTRLIAAALREGGVRTVAKVTGTEPHLIDTEGNDILIQRPTGHPSVLEQMLPFKLARKERATAAVIECMALRPSHQELDARINLPTISVITNVRADHLDMMGPLIEDVAESLTTTMVPGNTVITAEREEDRLKILRKRAEQLGCKFVVATWKDVTDEMMKPFPYLEHRENVAAVLEVCKLLNIPQDVALRGMHNAPPDPGVLRTYMLKCAGKSIEFINAFAANDPESLTIIWKRMEVRYSRAHTRITLLNSRGDRMQRSLQLARFVHDELFMDYLILVGDDTHLIKTTLLILGVKKDKIVNMGITRPEAVIEKIISLVEGDGAVFAIGNVGNMGEKIIKAVSQMCLVQHD